MEGERNQEENDLLGKLTGVVESDNGDGNDKEPLFEKLLTPSDVGKLNQLVLPKPQAEKCFLLGDPASYMSGGSSSSRRETKLCFEDAEDDKKGKVWRFRYSYWSSSQTYVFTRGWSRFVRDKRLAAGDAIVFYSHRNDVGRLYIGCRRSGDRPAAITTTAAAEEGDEDPQPTKKLRLFGVDLEYQPEDDSPSEPSSSSDSSSPPTHSQ